MSGIREDYIERMIHQLVSALAAIARLGKARKTDEALEQVQHTSLELFGMEYRLLITFDAGAVADLLGHPEKILALARLVETEAGLLEQRGDLEAVRHRLAHALALTREAQRRRVAPVAEDEAFARTVSEHLARVAPGP